MLANQITYILLPCEPRSHSIGQSNFTIIVDGIHPNTEEMDIVTNDMCPATVKDMQSTVYALTFAGLNFCGLPIFAFLFSQFVT